MQYLRLIGIKRMKKNTDCNSHLTWQILIYVEGNQDEIKVNKFFLHLNVKMKGK
jgi:hypothetical protein